MSEKYERRPNTSCITCEKPVYKRPVEIKQNRGKVYCSRDCYGISCRKEHSCSVCKVPILSREKKKTCSRKCSNINRAGIKYKGLKRRDKVTTQRILKQRIIENRGALCQKCSFDYSKILVVHHKDRNRENNSLSNLELLCPNCHALEHYG